MRLTSEDVWSYPWHTHFVFISDVDILHRHLQVIDYFGYEGRNQPIGLWRVCVVCRKCTSDDDLRTVTRLGRRPTSPGRVAIQRSQYAPSWRPASSSLLRQDHTWTQLMEPRGDRRPPPGLQPVGFQDSSNVW